MMFAFVQDRRDQMAAVQACRVLRRSIGAEIGNRPIQAATVVSAFISERAGQNAVLRWPRDGIAFLVNAKIKK